MLDLSKDWLYFKISRRWAFKYQEDKDFVWGRCTALISSKSPPGTSSDFLGKEDSSFQFRGKMMSCSIPHLKVAGRRKTCDCGTQAYYSFYLLHSLHSASWIFLLRYLLWSMEVYRKENVTNSKKILRDSSILNIPAKKLLNQATCFYSFSF